MRVHARPQAPQRGAGFLSVRAGPCAEHALLPGQGELAGPALRAVGSSQHSADPHGRAPARLAGALSVGVGLGAAWAAGRLALRAGSQQPRPRNRERCPGHPRGGRRARRLVSCRAGDDDGAGGPPAAAAEPEVVVGEDLSGPDERLCMLLAGFSFDSYTEADKAQGYWVCDGGREEIDVEGVKLCAFSPRFVRDAFHGILRVRVLSLSGLRGVPAAGAVGVQCRTRSGSPGGLCGSQRNGVRRGVLNGLARWQEEDDSIYLYVPRGGGDGGAAGSEGDRPLLEIEVQKANILTGSHFGLVGRVSVPAESWGAGELRELQLELKVPEELRAPKTEEGEAEEDAEQTSAQILLQLQYDLFQEACQQPATGCDELLDDVTPELRSRRRRYGACLPSEVLSPATETMGDTGLTRALRRRALPYADAGQEELRERLQRSLVAEKSLRDSGAMWSTLENLMGSSGKEQLQGALGAASNALETLSGDLFGALGAGISTGASELPGVKELFSGDFAGALDQRRRVWDAANTEQGRDALQRKAGAALQKARKQAMLRLAGGMELMSVRRGAWKMLEAAVLEEGDGAVSFSDYELLAYLEASATNTECWVWRLPSRQRLLVAFRGTCDFGDVLTDIAAVPREMGELGKIHDGFSRAYESIRNALHGVLERGCNGDATGWEILFTGHSLGGALATMASLDVARTGAGLAPKAFAKAGETRSSPLKGAEIMACTFGAPRVGSATFCSVYERWVPRAWRIFSKSDIIPTVPPTTLFGFRHCGIAVELDPTNKELIIRGRTEGLQAAAAKEKAEAAAQEVEALMGGGDEGGAVVRSGGDIWSSWDDDEIAELRRVLSTGTTAVGEHMEDNYFARIQEVLSADLDRRAARDEIDF